MDLAKGGQLRTRATLAYTVYETSDATRATATVDIRKSVCAISILASLAPVSVCHETFHITALPPPAPLPTCLFNFLASCEAAALGVHSTPSQTCILFAMPHATHASAKPPQAPYQHGTTSTHSRTKVIRGDCRPRVTDGSSLQPGQHPRQSATHTVHRQLCMNSGFQ